MFCKYCGNRLEDGDRFCGACGHPVEEKPMQETANEDSYKKQEEKVPRIKKKKPEPEYDNRMTEGMGYGYQMEQHPEDDDDDDEEEWEREEKKEKITFCYSWNYYRCSGGSYRIWCCKAGRCRKRRYEKKCRS